MRGVLPVFCLTIAILIPAISTASADWSMAGGDAARTGTTVAEPSLFPGLLWESLLAGPLAMEPVLARDTGGQWQATVYTITTGSATLTATQATNGNSSWSRALSAYVESPWVFRRAGGLAADADRAYVLITAQNGTANEWRELLVAPLRADGNVSWTFIAAVYTGGTPTVASAPLRVRDLVVFGSGDGHVRALRASTGAVVWDEALPRPVPLPVTFLATGNVLVGDFVLAADDAGTVYGLDVNGTANGDQGVPDTGTGDLVWTSDLRSPAVAAPVASPTAAFVAVGDRIVALHPAFGSTIWQQTVPASVVGPMSLSGNSLFFGAADGKVRALDATSGAVLWVRSLTALQAWIVATPTRLFTGSGTSMTALDPATGDVTWTRTFRSAVAYASISENRTGRGLIFAGQSSPNSLAALQGSSDLRAVDIAVSPISNPAVFQASIDATIKNAGDEGVSTRFRVWVNDTIGGVPTILTNTTVSSLKSGAGFTVSIPPWNFTTGTHTITLTVESVAGDRNPSNNVLSVKFFASPGPPRVIVEWSPAFWIALVIIGALGVGGGWLVGFAQQRREKELEKMLRERREASR